MPRESDVLVKLPPLLDGLGGWAGTRGHLPAATGGG